MPPSRRERGLVRIIFWLEAILRVVLLEVEQAVCNSEKLLESYTPVQDRAKSYVPVRTSTYQYIQVHASTGFLEKYVLVRTGIYN